MKPRLDTLTCSLDIFASSFPDEIVDVAVFGSYLDSPNTAQDIDIMIHTKTPEFLDENVTQLLSTIIGLPVLKIDRGLGYEKHPTPPKDFGLHCLALEADGDHQAFCIKNLKSLHRARAWR